MTQSTEAEPLVLAWPVPVTEREPEVAVRVPEREFRSERKGKDYFPKGVMDGRPLGTGNDSLPVTAHGRPEGAARDDVQELLGKAVVSVRISTRASYQSGARSAARLRGRAGAAYSPSPKPTCVVKTWTTASSITWCSG